MPICPPFAQAQNPIILDKIAKRYQCRPSELLKGEARDLWIDWICLRKGIKNDNYQAKIQNSKMRNKHGR